MNQETYVPHTYRPGNEGKALMKELRSNIIFLYIDHHFIFGNDQGSQMTTISKQDFKDPINDNLRSEQKISNSMLRASHFSLGDKSQMPPDQYATTYSTTMMPKASSGTDRKENTSFRSSIKINEDAPTNYLSESRSK